MTCFMRRHSFLAANFEFNSSEFENSKGKEITIKILVPFFHETHVQYVTMIIDS